MSKATWEELEKSINWVNFPGLQRATRPERIACWHFTGETIRAELTELLNVAFAMGRAAGLAAPRYAELIREWAEQPETD